MAASRIDGLVDWMPRVDRGFVDVRHGHLQERHADRHNETAVTLMTSKRTDVRDADARMRAGVSAVLASARSMSVQERDK